jgi:1-deoxy-D-xylulose-5-phosphate synthase
LRLADENPKIVGVTAAMPSGTGIDKLIEKYPDRFWDVAIAEQHAVTSMGSLAKEGFKPFCAIYSTFLQRGYDQIIHDIALMNLPVVFALDRAGVVGEDGETHQGVFDISFLRAIPNMHLIAPFNETSFIKILEFVSTFDRPISVRYPRGRFIADDFDVPEYKIAKSYIIKEGEDALFIGYGNGVGRAIKTAEYLGEIKPTILDLRFVKPLDSSTLRELSKEHKIWFVFSDSAKIGGVGSALGEFLQDEEILDVKIVSFEYSDNFITHGKTEIVERSLGVVPSQLAERVKRELEQTLVRV